MGGAQLLFVGRVQARAGHLLHTLDVLLLLLQAVLLVRRLLSGLGRALSLFLLVSAAVALLRGALGPGRLARAGFLSWALA